MPQVLDRVKVRTLRGAGTPPVDVVFLEEGLGSSGRVLWVVILHEPVIGKSFSDEWNKRGL